MNKHNFTIAIEMHRVGGVWYDLQGDEPFPGCGEDLPDTSGELALECQMDHVTEQRLWSGSLLEIDPPLPEPVRELIGAALTADGQERAIADSELPRLWKMYRRAIERYEHSLEANEDDTPND